MNAATTKVENNATNTFAGTFKQRPELKKSEANTIGFGADAPSDVDGYVRAIQEAQSCPVWNMETIEEVRWTLSGPLQDAAVTQNFGAEIDLFGSGKSVAGVAFVETTMRQPGQTQNWMLACAVGLHLATEPLNFAIPGNAWTKPAAGTTPPISPDAWTQNDRANAMFGDAVAAGTQTYKKASMWWGGWMQYAFWHLCRGYNVRWQVGRHTDIFDDVARNTAFSTSGGMGGSSSTSRVDTAVFVRRLNEYYEANGSALDFLKVDRTRVGSITSGAGANQGIFRPSRAFDQVEANYGGMDLKSALKGNSEWRSLVIPYIIQPGVPIGLYLQECDTVQANLMRQYLSITQRLAGATVPPIVTDAPFINDGLDGGVSPQGLELTLDAVPVPIAQRMDTGTAIYKGGEGKITLAVKGFQVDSDWARDLSTNKTLRESVAAAVGVGYYAEK